MGRCSTHRVAFTGEIVLDTSMHLGSGDESAHTDAPLLRDTEGEVIIAGTAIAGALRSRLEVLCGDALEPPHRWDDKSCTCLICNLFGTADGGASYVFVEDAYPEIMGTAEVRDSVAIRRDTQTARTHARYDMETIPAGSRFGFELSVELNRDLEQVEKELIFVGLEELRAGRVCLGGGSTRGLGRCHLDAGAVCAFDFTSTDCLVSYLKSEEPNKDSATRTGYDAYFSEVSDCPALKRRCAPMVRVEVDLDLVLDEIEDMMVVKDGRYAFGDAPDVRFVTTRKADANGWHKVHVVPGGSLKGPLRNRAEQVIRTLVQHPASACDPTDPHTRGGCGACFVCGLFGYARGGTDGQDSPGHRGRLMIEDAYPDGDIGEKVFDFVAIDRFTGGAMEKAKFNAKIATRGAFKTRLVIEEPTAEELALVAHLLKDLYLKDMRLAYGKYKGFGRVRGVAGQIRWLQTRMDDEGSSAGGLLRLLPEDSGSWSRSGIWDVLTIESGAFREGNRYRPLSDDHGFRRVIETLDGIFREFIDQASARRSDGGEA